MDCQPTDDTASATETSILVGLEQGPNYMYTPYSDFTEQEDFAAEYRAEIARLYTFVMPLMLFITSAFSRYVLDRKVVGSALFFCSLFFFVLGLIVYVYFDTMFDMFSVGDFLKLHTLFYVWPVLPLFFGLFTASVASGDAAEWGSAIAVMSVIFMATNCFAYVQSRETELERLRQWPPLPGTEIETYLHC